MGSFINEEIAGLWLKIYRRKDSLSAVIDGVLYKLVKAKESEFKKRGATFTLFRIWVGLKSKVVYLFGGSLELRDAYFDRIDEKELRDLAKTKF